MPYLDQSLSSCSYGYSASEDSRPAVSLERSFLDDVEAVERCLPNNHPDPDIRTRITKKYLDLFRTARPILMTAKLRRQLMQPSGQQIKDHLDTLMSNGYDLLIAQLDGESPDFGFRQPHAFAKTLRHLARTSLKSDSSGHESYEEDVAASAASASDPERALRCKRALDANQRASDALLAESEKAWAMAVLQEFNIMRADRSEQKQAGLATDDLVDLSEIYGFAVTAARKMLAGMPAARDEALEAMKQEQAERPEPKATEFTRAIAKGAGVCDTMVRLWAKMLKASLTGQ